MTSSNYTPNIQSTDEIVLTCTLFPTVQANTCQTLTLPWREIARRLSDPKHLYDTKDRAPLLSFALYDGSKTAKGSLRHAAAITQVFAVEGDYDAEGIPLTQAAQMLTNAGIAAVLYTSPSNGAYNVKTNTFHGHRWRVIAPLSKPHDPFERRRLVGVLNAVLGNVLTKESFQLSQSFYFGRIDNSIFESQIVPGEPLDVVAEQLELDPVYPVNLPEARTSDRGARIQDPRDKPDIVGQFCRAYEPAEALAMLSDTFTHDRGNRYSWVGHAPGGVFITDDNQHVGASHDTWPAGTNGLMNSFDLIRQFRFDPELSELNSPLPPYKRPSFYKMLDWMRQDERFAPYLSSKEPMTHTDVDPQDLDVYLEEQGIEPRAVTYTPPEPPTPIQPFRGVMQEMVTAMVLTAHRQQPALSIAAVLAAMASGCPGFYRLPTHGRLNLFVMGIVGTALGKDHPRVCAELLADTVGAKIIGGAGMTGQGLEDEIPPGEPPRQSLLLSVDEVGHWMSTMTDHRASINHTILAGNLLRLFSAGSSFLMGRSRAEKPGRRHGHPTVNLLGFSTPERLAESVSHKNIADGLLGRMLVVRGALDAPFRRSAGGFNLPTNVQLKALELEDIANRTGEQASLLTQGIVIQIDPAADRELDRIAQAFEQGDTSSIAGVLGRRSYEKVLRIAGVLAVWDRPLEPVIETDHVTWAEQFVRLSNSTLLDFAGEEMIATDFVGQMDKVVELCRKAQAGGFKAQKPNEQTLMSVGLAPHSLVLRLSKMGSRDFAGVIDTLIQSGRLSRRDIKLNTGVGDKQNENRVAIGYYVDGGN